MQGLTGVSPSELVAFRPQRLALHELLIRVTADFAVPDGSRIGDLGINFREIVSLLLARYLVPEMDAITAAYDRTRHELRNAIDAAFAEVVPEQVPLAAPKASPASRLFARIVPRRAAPAIAFDGDWGPRHIGDCERLADLAADPQQRAVYRSLARVMSALFTNQGHAWGHENSSCRWRPTWHATIAAAIPSAEPSNPCCCERRVPRVIACCRAEAPVVINTRAVRFGQEHVAAAAEEARGRHRRAVE